MSQCRFGVKMAKKTFAPVILLVFCFVVNAVSETLAFDVKTQNGPIQGILKEARGGAKYVEFLGLRYANPVVRFQPAEPLKERWTNPKLANTLGNICPQTNYGDEDCLFLNVYVPEKYMKSQSELSKLPVMVWIHGGAFILGDGNGYEPNYFMESEDVILVTLNYRLGVFGFLSTGDEATTANIGLRDQVMALQWVKENIAAFNGDPTNVTIFGESAGAACVHFLLMTPTAEGLFHRAIIQSGTLSFWTYATNPREAALKLAKESCENVIEGSTQIEQSLQIRECLEKADMSQLSLSQMTSWPRWPPANPVPRFLPTANIALTAEHKMKHDSFFASPPQLRLTERENVYPNKVPVIIGLTADEGSTLFAASVYEKEETLQQLNEEWNQVAPKTFMYEGHFPDKDLPEISQKIKKFYFGSDPISLENKQSLADLYSDTWFLLQSLAVADEMSRVGMSVYPYLFSYWGSWSLRNVFSQDQNIDDIYEGQTGHADDVQYLFPHPVIGPPLKPDSEEEEFSKAFVKLWTSFAKQGKPTVNWLGGKTLEWKPIQPQNETPLIFDMLKIDKDLSIIKLDVNARIDFWRTLLQDYSQEKEKFDEKNLPKIEL
ncbi:unnamed protein product [Orchesella dallaii]|uniref:Carboxylesterase type B domain-containing protein n=1 Tax=Orchesella dallaii TaxID=48710 RepID=A0ABP1RBT8_9HEXA